VTELGALKESLVRIQPQALLLDLDLPGLDGPKSIAGFIKSHATTKIIVLSGTISDQMELALFKAGVRGCCRSDIDPQLLKRIIVAIQHGELWIRRTLTPLLLDELGASARDEETNARRANANLGRLADLTRREREIAALVASGENNKQIARRLAITERTVKAHLTETFRKLGIPDRLKLALLVMGIDDT
jgi:two-component system NarL family response regulator